MQCNYLSFEIIFNIIVVVECNLNTDQSRPIRAHLNYLLKNVEIIELPLNMSCYNVEIITSVEIHNITSKTNLQRQVQLLLFLIARKPRRCYNQSLRALNKTGQEHVSSNSGRKLVNNWFLYSCTIYYY